MRTAGTDEQIARAIHSAIRSLDPAIPLPAVTTLENATGVTLVNSAHCGHGYRRPRRRGTAPRGAGLYGVIAYSVSRRTREIGIRVALGARRSDALALVLGEGIRLAVSGVAIGLILASAATRLIAGFLFDVSALDAAAFGGMSIAFLIVAGVATYLPARRAAAMQPMDALRSEWST